MVPKEILDRMRFLKPAFFVEEECRRAVYSAYIKFLPEGFVVIRDE